MTDFLHKYSASFIVLYGYTRFAKSILKMERSPEPIEGSRPLYSLLHGIKDFADAKSYPINSPHAAPNRQGLKRWHQHSIANNHKLIVSLLPSGNHASNGVRFDEVKNFLRSSGTTYYGFDDYLSTIRTPAAQLYRVHDTHLNIEGNQKIRSISAGRIEERKVWRVM